MQTSRVGVLIGAPGIGGAVWHEPALRALASARGSLTLFARTSAQAGALFGHEPWASRVIPFSRRRGSAGVRDYLDLVGKLRAAELSEIWIFHDHAYYAMAAWQAGVAVRHGPGLPKQQRFLKGGETVRPDLACVGEGGVVETTRALLRANGVSVPRATPRLTVDPVAKQRALTLFMQRPRPWIALGTTCDEARRRWVPYRFAELCVELGARTGGTVFFMGGPNHAGQIRETTRYLDGVKGWVDTSQIPLPLEVSTALISLSDVFVGSDSGPMNIAAAVGAPTYGLFGDHMPHGSISPEVTAVLPNFRRESRNGMDGITTAAILERLSADGVFRLAMRAQSFSRFG